MAAKYQVPRLQWMYTGGAQPTYLVAHQRICCLQSDTLSVSTAAPIDKEATTTDAVVDNLLPTLEAVLLTHQTHAY